MQRVLRSVRGQVVLAAVFATSVTLVLVGGLILAGVSRDEQAALDRRLERRADQLARPAVLAAFGGRAERPLIEGLAATVLAVNDLGVRFSERGVVLTSVGTALPPSTAPAQTPGLRTVRVGAERWRVATRSVLGRPGTVAEVSASLAPVQGTVQRLRTRMLVIGIAGLLLAAALAAAASGRAVAALGRLRRAAGEVADTTHLDRRIAPGGPAEVRQVGDALNALLGRLQRSVDERERATDATRRFAADAGHELRTPLATLGASLETLERNPDLGRDDRREIVAEAVAEQRRLTALVAALQALTRGDAGALGDERYVDLASAIGDAARAAEAAGGVQIEVDVAELPAVEASPTGLRLLLDNLLRNAAQHARRGRPAAQVVVSLRRPEGEADGPAVLTVDDDGPGIDPAQRDAVLERFVRGTGAHGDGSGLGLAVAAQQARLLGGPLVLGDAPAGGLRVTVTIPLRRTTSAGGAPA